MTGQTEAKSALTVFRGELKRCSKCKRNLSLALFCKDKGSKDGLCPQCRECRAIFKKKWDKSEKGKLIKKAHDKKYHESKRGQITYKNSRLKRIYNITLEQYDQMFEQQNGVCAVCKNPEIAKNQHSLLRLAVDHDHETGKVRGLLCQKCNQAIGLMSENIKILKEAVDYLEKKD